MSKEEAYYYYFFACWMNSWRTHISCKERAPSQLVSSSCHLPLFSAGNRPKSHGRIAWAWFNIRRRQRRFSTLISTSRQLGGANRNVIWYSNYSLSFAISSLLHSLQNDERNLQRRYEWNCHRPLVVTWWIDGWNLYEPVAKKWSLPEFHAKNVILYFVFNSDVFIFLTKK